MIPQTPNIKLYTAKQWVLEEGTLGLGDQLNNTSLVRTPAPILEN